MQLFCSEISGYAQVRIVIFDIAYPTFPCHNFRDLPFRVLYDCFG